MQKEGPHRAKAYRWGPQQKEQTKNYATTTIKETPQKATQSATQEDTTDKRQTKQTNTKSAPDALETATAHFQNKKNYDRIKNKLPKLRPVKGKEVKPWRSSCLNSYCLS